jgi:hypothetical protein
MQLLAKMKAGGFGDAKVFMPEDLKNFKAEDWQAKFGGAASKARPRSPPPGSKKASKARKTRHSEEDMDEGETIDL